MSDRSLRRPAQDISLALFSAQFLDKSPEMAAARMIHLKSVFGGVTARAIVIFAVFSIYWGAVWKAPEHTLPSWIVDFDGGVIGQAVSNALSGINPWKNGVFWQVVPATQFPDGIAQLENAIVQEQTWYALTIHRGASKNLTAAVFAADSSYNSSLAITFIGSEARNENIYRGFISHLVIAAGSTAVLFLPRSRSSHTNSNSSKHLFFTRPRNDPLNGSIIRYAPYLLHHHPTNLRPFDVAVASAVTFVGLIYLLILAVSVLLMRINKLSHTRQPYIYLAHSPGARPLADFTQWILWVTSRRRPVEGHPRKVGIPVYLRGRRGFESS
ncbi:hypothetical protein FB451DRAFT_1131292 [Mycena latifolia]|nr:hypothetical protein FB451DRAFT_1131292 [Mycena latifolia]